MSELKISYSQLSSVSRYSKNAAKDLTNYSERLSKEPIKYLDKLTRGHSNLTSSSVGYINTKQSLLKKKIERLEDFSDEIKKFSENVKETDKGVAKRINTLYKSFKNNNKSRLNISPVSEFFTWLGTNLVNSTELGRWVSSAFNHIKNKWDNFYDHMEIWYRTGGGKYIIKAIGSALLAAATIAGLFVSGIGVIAIIAGVITIYNSLTKSYYNYKAYNNNGEDPAWAHRYGKIDSFSGHLRESSNSKFASKLARAWDFTDGVVSLLVLGKDIGKIGKSIVEFGKKKNLNSLKTLFGTTGKKNSVGIVGEKFMIRSIKDDGTIWKMNPKSFFNGCVSLKNDGKFRGEVFKSLGTLWGEFKGLIGYKKAFFKQGTQVFKELLSADTLKRNRSKGIMKNASKEGLINIKNYIKDCYTEKFKKINDQKIKGGKFKEFIVKGTQKINTVYELAENTIVKEKRGKIFHPNVYKLINLPKDFSKKIDLITGNNVKPMKFNKLDFNINIKHIPIVNF
ncbi:hypothetical protein [Clostridium tertium]|uniref:Uncharacterized protein n=1 Tax=Clostridium tertium TaxID=1559 RepID=A0A6N3A1Q3_9CLOT